MASGSSNVTFFVGDFLSGVVGISAGLGLLMKDVHGSSIFAFFNSFSMIEGLRLDMSCSLVAAISISDISARRCLFSASIPASTSLFCCPFWPTRPLSFFDFGAFWLYEAFVFDDTF